MAAFTPSLSAATVFDTVDRVNQGEALTWAGEVEDQLVALTSGLVTAAVFTAGALTIPSTFAPGIVYDIDTLAVDSTITLPSAAAAAGKVLWFKRTVDSSYKVTVQRAGTDTIDGATMTGFAVLSQGDMAGLVAKAGKWVSVGVRIAPIVELVTTTEASRQLYPGTVALDFEIVGGGGGGGGINGIATSGSIGAGGGGQAGSESRGRLDTRALTAVGLTIGAAGAGGLAGANNGSTGGASELTWASGANKVTSGGGVGGRGADAATTATVNLGGSGGAPSTTGSMTAVSGLVQRAGEQGGPGIMPGVAAQTVTGNGGSTSMGSGAPATTTSGQGAAATGYGGGGEGAKSTANDTTNYAGGAGTQGAIRLIHHILR